MAAVQAVTQVQQQQQGQVASSSTGTTGERSWSRLSPKPRCLNRAIESKRHHRIPNRCLEVETEAKLRAGEMLAVRRRGGLGPPPTEVRRCCCGPPARLQPSFLSFPRARVEGSSQTCSCQPSRRIFGTSTILCRGSCLRTGMLCDRSFICKILGLIPRNLWETFVPKALRD